MNSSSDPGELNVLYAAAEENTDDPAAWFRLGEALLTRLAQYPSRDDRAAAREALMHAGLVTSDSALLVKIADALLGLEDMELPQTLVQRLVEQGATVSGSSGERIARHLLESRRYSEALSILERAGSLLDSHPNLRLFRAHALHELGNFSRALADATEVTIREPNSFHAGVLRAKILTALQRHEECAAEWRRLLDLRPTSVHASLGLGGALAAMGRDAEAIRVLTAATARHPESIDARLTLAWVLRRAQRLTDAEDAARSAIAIDPGSPRARFELGLVLEAMGRLGPAIGAYREALERGAEGPRPLVQLATALRAYGRKDEAEEALMKAAALAHDQPTLRTEIADSLAALRSDTLPRTSGGAFTGRLGAFFLFEVFEILQQRQSTGRLELMLPGDTATIFMKDGRLVRVHSGRKKPLSAFLEDSPHRADVAVDDLWGFMDTDSDLVRALAPQVLQPLQLAQAVQVLDLYFDAREGQFTFHAEPIDPEPGDVDLDIRLITFEIARVRDESGRR